MKEVFDVIILGAGASGMMCASTIKRKKVAVVDQAKNAAKKIMVTGNGRCNLGNNSISSKFYNRNIDSFLKQFSEIETAKFFSDLGLVTYVDDEGRIYPISNSAKSVMDILEYGARKASFFLGERIKNIKREGTSFVVNIETKIITSPKIVVATGGGSDEILKMLKVPYKEFVPSLVSLKSKQTRDLNGTRVSNVLVKATNAFGKTRSEKGEVLFRENGLSGIVIFNLSTLYARSGRFEGKVEIDLLPDLSEQTLKDILRKRKSLEARLDKFFVGMFANSVANEIFKQSKLNTNAPCATLKENEILILANTIKNMQFNVCGALDNNQVFSGGVPLEDLDENLMHKNLQGVYFVGEICDVDGVCGGYNLQWAWTSGHIVGEEI